MHDLLKQFAMIHFGNAGGTTAYFGLLANARVFCRRAVAHAEREDEKEVAAGYESGSAVTEALFGNIAESRHRTDSALTLSTNRDVQYNVALALALIEDAPRAQELTDDVSKRFPEDSWSSKGNWRRPLKNR